ncbi:MAG: peptide ABC transporter ATP-binding protein [Nitrospinae bacterium CG11_big_fil_rev_8_21_14_0_20_56_8]|nr:MAG: peptide ABC transporter ATP-binding protein [Nitrospinae bacterium CG11_big_fil_rev_8_21_14_0_20_56_8]
MESCELQVRNLKVAFSSGAESLIAVNSVSYDLYRGETLALVGESGCGKTVTALSTLRLVPVPPGQYLSGEILLGARDILQLHPKQLRDLRGKEIAMIFQDPMTSLNPVLTIGEQIIETLLQHTDLSRAEARNRAEELLRRVEIPGPREKLRHYPHQLSGGMRQRAMIAMALSCSPRVLIADEPTTALDVLIQAQILDLLQHLKEETGMSVLLITHDLGVVSEIAQRVMVMYAGEIVEAGPAKTLLDRPLHPYTFGLMRSMPRMGQFGERKSRLQEIKGNVPSLRHRPSGCPFHPRCPSAVARCREEAPVLEKMGSDRHLACWVPMES